MKQGINVDSWKRHTPELTAFSNLFMLNDGPRFQNSTGKIGEPDWENPNLDKWGWPKINHSVVAILQPTHPGVYTINSSSSVLVTVMPGKGAVSSISSLGSTIEVTVDNTQSPPHGGIYLKVSRIGNESTPPNVSVRRKGISAAGVFTDEYLETLMPYDTLRFMNTANTNGIKSQWPDNFMFDSYSYFSQHNPWGGSIERMVQLCNEVDANMWDCVPDRPLSMNQADYYDYVRTRAEYIKEGLLDGKKVYVEHSNEVWNSGFSQYHRVLMRASDNSGLMTVAGGNKWYAQRILHALETNEISHIYKSVLGQDRVVGVLGAQHYGIDTARRGLDYLAGTNIVSFIDAIAVAPYLGHSVSASGGLDNAVDQLTSELDLFESKLEQFVGLADSYDLSLISYEQNHHIFYDKETRQKLPQEFLDLRDDEEVVELCEDAYDICVESGMDLTCLFKLPGVPTVWSLNPESPLKQMYDNKGGIVSGVPATPVPEQPDLPGIEPEPPVVDSPPALEPELPTTSPCPSLGILRSDIAEIKEDVLSIKQLLLIGSKGTVVLSHG